MAGAPPSPWYGAAAPTAPYYGYGAAASPFATGAATAAAMVAANAALAQVPSAPYYFPGANPAEVQAQNAIHRRSIRATSCTKSIDPFQACYYAAILVQGARRKLDFEGAHRLQHWRSGSWEMGGAPYQWLSVFR